MNKPYQSRLAPLLENYLAYRCSIGFASRQMRGLLREFDEFIVKTQADLRNLTPSYFLTFKRSCNGSAGTRNQKISAVRSFFDYLVRCEIVPANPVKDIPADTENAYIPFVFSAGQTEKLLHALEKTIRREEAFFFKDLTVYTAIMLLARCGLRIAEPTRLTLEHYHQAEGSLYIENTKFHKDRLIVIPRLCLAHMQNYLNVRTAFMPNRKNQHLLPGPDERKLPLKDIYMAFHHTLDILSLNQPRQVIGNVRFGSPTPHSLRHSFAINTLKRIRDKGGSPQEALPILSAYMGHRKYRYTAVYLKVLDAEHRQHLIDFAIRRQEEI